MRKCLPFLLIVFLSFEGFAQTCKTEGKIMDTKTNFALAGATSRVGGSPGAAVSDLDGRYNIHFSAKKSFWKKTSLGYSTKKITGLPAGAGESMHLAKW